jgi:hypothetical protein
MGMKVCSVVRCCACAAVSVTTQEAFDLSLPLPSSAAGAPGASGAGSAWGEDTNRFEGLTKKQIQRMKRADAAKSRQSAAARRAGGRSETENALQRARDKAAAFAAKVQAKNKRAREAAQAAAKAKADAALESGKVTSSTPSVLARPSETWLKRASKRDLLEWLFAHSTPGILAEHGLQLGAANLKKLMRKVICRDLIEAVHQTVDAAEAAAKAPTPPADAGQGEDDSPPPPKKTRDCDCQTDALPDGWIADDVAESAASAVLTDLLPQVGRRVAELDAEDAAAEVMEALLEQVELDTAAAASGAGADDPAYADEATDEEEDGGDDEEGEEETIVLPPAGPQAALRAELPGGYVLPAAVRAKPGSRSLTACLAALVAEETLSPDTGNGYRCSRCAAAWEASEHASGNTEASASKAPTVSATKRLVILRPPHVLCVHIKRFAMSSRGSLVKRPDRVSLPKTLDLAPVCAITPEQAACARDAAMEDRQLQTASEPAADGAASGEAAAGEAAAAAETAAGEPSEEELLAAIGRRRAPERYALKAVVVHQGSSLTSGHYVAAVRDAIGWAMASDLSIRRITEADAHGQQAYMCVYERIA